MRIWDWMRLSIVYWLTVCAISVIFSGYFAAYWRQISAVPSVEASSCSRISKG